MSTGIVAAEKVLKNIVPNESNDKKDSNVIPKDFYWDQIVFYLVSALLGLSFVDISVEFFRGSSVQCFTPTDELSSPNRDHFAFLNSYCFGSLPNTQFYLIFVLVSALLIIVPHYLWIAYFGKHFDFFFDLLKKLDRLHDPNTGEYDPFNFSCIEKLEERFSRDDSNSIFRWYWMKLVAQFAVSIFTLVFNFLYFKEFDANFTCKITFNSTEWPYSTRDIPCVYNSLTLLRLLQIAAGVLVGLVIVILLIGFIWCFGRHTTELGAKDIASFCFQSCLLPDKYNFSTRREMFHSYQYFQYRKLAFLDHRLCLFNFTLKLPTLKSLKLYIEKLRYPKIQNDLDFLLLRLFFADSGHGRVFRDIQIEKEFKMMIEQDHELLHLLVRVHADMLKDKLRRRNNRNTETVPDRSLDLRECFFKAGFQIDKINTAEFSIYQQVKDEIGIEERDLTVSPFRNVLYGFFKFVEKNDVAVDIAFETKHGYSLILARAFGSVTTVYFDRYFRPTNNNVVLQKLYAPSYDVTVYPDNIFSHEAGHITEADSTVFDLFTEEERDPISLIMVGPITERPKIVSTNLLINKIYENKLIASGAMLIAVRPLLIEGKTVFDHFQQFIPPKGLFKSIPVINDLLKERVPIYSVSKKGSHQFERLMENSITSKDAKIGVGVMCNNVRCIFEFCVYEYEGRTKTQSNDNISADNGDGSRTSV